MAAPTAAPTAPTFTAASTCDDHHYDDPWQAETTFTGEKYDESFFCLPKRLRYERTFSHQLFERFSERHFGDGFVFERRPRARGLPATWPEFTITGTDASAPNTKCIEWGEVRRARARARAPSLSLLGTFARARAPTRRSAGRCRPRTRARA